MNFAIILKYYATQCCIMKILQNHKKRLVNTYVSNQYFIHLKRDDQPNTAHTQVFKSNALNELIEFFPKYYLCTYPKSQERQFSHVIIIIRFVVHDDALWFGYMRLRLVMAPCRWLSLALSIMSNQSNWIWLQSLFDIFTKNRTIYTHIHG